MPKWSPETKYIYFISVVPNKIYESNLRKYLPTYYNIYKKYNLFTKTNKTITN